MASRSAPKEFATSSNGLRIAATDSYRLAVAHIPGVGWNQPETLVPAAALRHVATVADGDLHARFGTDSATFRTDRWQLTTRLVAGEYPKWESLVPTEPGDWSVTVNAENLKQVLHRVGLFTDTAVALTGNGGELVVEAASDTGDAHDSLPATIEGNLPRIGFNPGFLVDSAPHELA